MYHSNPINIFFFVCVIHMYGNCPKILYTVFHTFWPKFCFLCFYFLKYLVEWQTVQTLIRLILKDCIYHFVRNINVPEFSETPNPAYFYAYFCFCTRKISFRGFSFTLYCHRTSNWTSKTYRGLPKFLLSVEIDTRDVQKIVKKPAHF